MKTLILAFLSNIFVGTTAQTTIVAKQPIIVNATPNSTYQVNEVLPLSDGNLLIGRSQNTQSEPKTILLKTTKTGKVLKKTELLLPPAVSACFQENQSLILLNADREKAFLTKLSDYDSKEVLWQIELPKTKGGSLASLPNGKIALVTDTENFTKIQFFSADGNFLNDILLKKEVKGFSPKSKIIALSDGTWAVIGGGKIWGLTENGETLWQFGSETEKISWQNIKQLTNGEIVAIGSGKTELFDTTNDDIHFWAIAKDGGKINWASIIGEDESQETAYDLAESSNNGLMILATKNQQTQLIKLDHEHQPSIAYSENGNNKNTRLRFLIANESNDWVAIGNTLDENGRKIIVQGFGQKVMVNTHQAPSLYLISIGVNGPVLSYAKRDAEKIGELYTNCNSNAFKTIHTQTITADSSTKAGELAKKFELLSSSINLQSNDLLVVFFSGNGIKAEGDYLLLGSDFDAAALRSTSVSLSQLIKDLDNLPCRKLLILDACQSGAATELNLPNNISILTASTANQVAFEDPKWQHGALTKVLIEALNTHKADSNADGYTTLNELFDYTKRKLPLLTQNKRPQNPLLLHKGDDFVVFEK